jgi:predicted GNAT superfamily acetyltransferase
MRIDRATVDDYPAILRLNEAAVPHVNSISRAVLDDLARQAFYFRVARQEGLIAGFLLALSQGALYGSPNFRWFSARYSNFVYVDRIVVSSSCRRSGVGHDLYVDLERATSKSAPVLTCEVNLQPPNPSSLAFHKRLGFAEVGRQQTDDGRKLVCLMLKRLS